jgi:phosphoribosyl 1,2-cyclic phosphate phosphodiesterase
MRLLVLGCGTSTGVPLPGCSCAVCTSTDPKNRRDRTSALITGDDGYTVLIDASTDMRHQCLRWNVTDVRAVFFTHAHSDHVCGIDDLRCFNYVHNQIIPCYMTPPTAAEVTQRFDYIFSPDQKYEGGGLAKLRVEPFNNGDIISIGSISFQTFPLRHGHWEVSGFRIGELGYATDCKVVPPSSIQLLKGVRYLILDGLREGPSHPTHLTINEAIAVAQQIGAEKTFLTHMTHSVDYQEVSRKLPEGVELCYDGMEIEFGGG